MSEIQFIWKGAERKNSSNQLESTRTLEGVYITSGSSTCRVVAHNQDSVVLRRASTNGIKELSQDQMVTLRHLASMASVGRIWRRGADGSIQIMAGAKTA